jgi:hypothetical protein
VRPPTIFSATGLLIAGALLGGLPGEAGARRPAPPPVPAISPLAGTPDASPQTQISILGVPWRRIGSVRVVGSESGLHPGKLAAYASAPGASFVLARPLVAGEHVSVRVRIDGGPQAADSFTVAEPAPVAPVLAGNLTQPAKLDHFTSQPALLPPRITAPARPGAGLAPGDIFLTPLPSPEVHPGSDNELTIHPVGPGGPMIVTRSGRLVWFDQLPPPTVATNFGPERLHGREVLTWWQGKVTIAAFGEGEGVIASPSYRILKIVHTGNGYAADLHEFMVTNSGQAYFTIYSPISVHLPGTPAGQRSRLLDSIVQEVDLRTGLVMWEWHAYGHVSLRDSYATAANSASLDAYHLNSIQVLSGGRLLISARDTSAVYEVDQRTGAIVWTLGGRDSSFRLGRGARFWFQHDARLLPGDRVSLFDDEAGPPAKARASRGLILSLNLRRRTASLLHQYRVSAPGDLADSEGSLQTLAGGDRFAGFGSSRYMAEFSASGRLRYRASLPVDDGSYRAFLYPWQATPLAPPTVVERRASPSRVDVYASWNGATTVARWEVLGASGGGRWRELATVQDRSFETRLTLRSRATKLLVRALSAHGRVLARAAPVSAS